MFLVWQWHQIEIAEFSISLMDSGVTIDSSELPERLAWGPLQFSLAKVLTVPSNSFGCAAISLCLIACLSLATEFAGVKDGTCGGRFIQAWEETIPLMAAGA